MTLRCAEYLRVSSERQEGGASLDEQAGALRAFAQARGWQIVATYEETASTWHGERAAFDQMLENARAGKFERILVWKLDRFGRRSGQIHAVTEELEALGIYLVLVQDGIDLSLGGVAAKAVKAALALAADLENEARADRSRMAWHHRKALRLFHGGFPTGYDYGGQKYQPAVINESEAAGVRRAFRLYASNQYSIIDLCSKLNDEGYRVKSGKRYSYRSLHSILTNPVYAGRMDVDGELVDSNEPALISWDLFEKAQQVIAQHARAPRSTSRKFAEYLLKGLVYCRACGHKMYAQRTGTAREPRYKDACYFQRRMCPADAEIQEQGVPLTIREDVLAPQIEALIASFSLLPSWRERVLDILASRDERRAIEARRRAIEARLERIKWLYVEGDLDLGVYRSERDGLKAELAGLVVPQETTVLDAGQLLEDMAQVWEVATLGERHDLLHSIFRKIWVDRVSQTIVSVEVYPAYVPVFHQVPGLAYEGEGVFGLVPAEVVEWVEVT